MGAALNLDRSEATLPPPSSRPALVLVQGGADDPAGPDRYCVDLDTSNPRTLKVWDRSTRIPRRYVLSSVPPILVITTWLEDHEGRAACGDGAPASPHVVGGTPREKGDAKRFVRARGLWNPECTNPACVKARDDAAKKAHDDAVKATRLHRRDAVPAENVIDRVSDSPNATPAQVVAALAWVRAPDVIPAPGTRPDRTVEALADRIVAARALIEPPTIWRKEPSEALSLLKGHGANDSRRVPVHRCGEAFRTAMRHYEVRPLRSGMDRDDFAAEAITEFLHAAAFNPFVSEPKRGRVPPPPPPAEDFGDYPGGDDDIPF